MISNSNKGITSILGYILFCLVKVVY